MEKQKSTKADIIQTILLAAILAIMILIGITVMTEIGRVQRTMTMIEADLEEINMEEVNSTISALNNAASQLGQIDTTTLNNLITSLDATADTLEGFSSALGGLFGR